MTPRFKFKPEMFRSANDGINFAAPAQAQAALDEYLKTCPVVYGSRDTKGWIFDQTKTDEDTHEAILFDLRPIEKPECEHEPTIGNIIGVYGTAYPTCSKCGAKLKATWSEVKP